MQCLAVCVHCGMMKSTQLSYLSHHFMVRTYKIYSTISEYVVCYTLLVPTGPVFHSRSLKILHLPGFVVLASFTTCLGPSVPLSRAFESTQGRDKIILAFSVPVFSVSREIRPETTLMPMERTDVPLKDILILDASYAAGDHFLQNLFSPSKHRHLSS